MNEIFLSRIFIHDFRTFGDFEIEIPAAPGLVLLTGTNGLGKSSFFDAIEWGLTNKIRRFEPYLQKGRKKLAEKDYLTRRGAEPGSHHVSLTFSGCDPIERMSDGGTAMADIITQLARPDRRTINDLGAYLALTHFLGQAAQQRFTSRDPQDQWQALKGPSGIDRLERIRTGLRGRPTVTAFTRRIEREQTAVAKLDRQIADWQGWMTRMERLRSAARASGVLSTEELVGRIDRLEVDLQQLMGDQSVAVTGEDVGQRLAALRERIDEALRASVERKAALEALSTLPSQFEASLDEARLDHPNLVRLRSEMDDARARVERAKLHANSANDAVSVQNTAVGIINQNIATLEAGRADLARRTQLAELLAAVVKERMTLDEMIVAHRTTIKNTTATINQHEKVVAEVAQLRSLAASARVLSDSIADYLNLEAQAGAAKSALAQGLEAAKRAASAVIPLEQQFADIEMRIAAAERERAEADRHASAISA